MPSIGDLANDLAQAVYQNRIPVAIGSITVAVALVILALRLGWVAAARRHPGRTGVVVVIALLVALPVGWYLGSPIIVRTSLVEALPVSVPVPTAALATPPAPPSNASSAPPATTAPTATPAPFVVTTITSGEFSGTDEFHFGSGTASIIEIAPGRYHLRLEDFSVRNGPDLFVYLSPSPEGWTEDALELGTLKATDGSFGYDLPAGTDPGAFQSAVIWCKQFSHLFAVAPFGA